MGFIHESVLHLSHWYLHPSSTVSLRCACFPPGMQSLKVCSRKSPGYWQEPLCQVAAPACPSYWVWCNKTPLLSRSVLLAGSLAGESSLLHGSGPLIDCGGYIADDMGATDGVAAVSCIDDAGMGAAQIADSHCWELGVGGRLHAKDGPRAGMEYHWSAFLAFVGPMVSPLGIHVQQRAESKHSSDKCCCCMIQVSSWTDSYLKVAHLLILEY